MKKSKGTWATLGAALGGIWNLVWSALRWYWQWSMRRGSWWGKCLAIGLPSLLALGLLSSALGGDNAPNDPAKPAAAYQPARVAQQPSSPASSSQPVQAPIMEVELPSNPPALPNTPVPAVPTNTRILPTPTAVTPIYEIVKRDDVSFGGTVRIIFRVRVAGPLTEQQVTSIANTIIDGEVRRHGVNAIGFFFYLPGTDPFDVYTAGTVDWAPNGVWSDADTVKTGNYAKHKFGNLRLGRAY